MRNTRTTADVIDFQIKILLATAISVNCLSMSVASAQSNLAGSERFVSQAGRFSVRMTNPTYEAAVQSTGTDDVQHQFVSGFDQGVFLVAYQDHEDIEPSDTSAKENAYRQFAITFGKSVGGSARTYSEIAQNQISGRQFDCDLPLQSGKSRSRMFWVRQRLYHILAMGTNEFVESNQTKIFLESFAIAK